ncbi:hypothetical protein [Pseudomonas triticicola]|uniref:hypothetical protein n=1 Tax=Pseudomonas triticicola TaxID=2842345 RepID=UPI003EBC437C
MQINITWGRIAGALVILIPLVALLDQHYQSSTQNHINDLNNQIKAYEKSSTWKLPETLKQLNSVSEKLDKQLQTQGDLVKLGNENDELEKNNYQLTQKLNTAQGENDDLRAISKQLTEQLKQALISPQEFVLTAGSSAELVKNHITFGVEDVYPTWVVGNINNENVRLNIGNYKSVKILDDTCTLRLSKISRPSAQFSYTCQQN